MNKSVSLAIAVLLTACAAPPAPPPPVVAVVKAKQDFPPRPLTLLYTTFQDHAVIQRDRPIPVWGLTKPGATVEVSLGVSVASATADAEGHWRADLPAMKAGGPYTLSAKSSAGESQTLKDILIGDVYLCSGQSNMEMPLRLATNYDLEVRTASNPNIRLFHVQRFTSPVPKTTFGSDATWSVTSPETVKEFSAVCYYFGREVQPVAGVPVGLIEDAWGGAAIQAWISNERLLALGGYDELVATAKLYASDPKAADARWRAIARTWWTTNDPLFKTNPADPALDDSTWGAMPAGGWTTSGIAELKTFRGIVWLRKTIELSAAQAKNAATLSLGQINVTDMAFVNGKEVGAGDGYDVSRAYEIPAGLLHEGKNVIALTIQGGDGFLSPPDKLMLKLGDGNAVPLGGTWRYKISTPFAATGRAPHMPWLNQFGGSVLYNGMIVPLGETQVRAILWYQGESDTWQPKEYARLMRGLIDDWRVKFGEATPFYMVQLTSFGPITSGKPMPSEWAALREVQRQVANTTPNTGLAVTYDLGLPDIIHSSAKQEVGRRLALLAEKDIYGKPVIAASPAPVSTERHGKKIVIRFANAPAGLVTYNWDRAVGFALCDAKGTCRYADGLLAKDTITLNAPSTVTSVRYCWADSPMCNLFSPEGLPAVPFEMAVSLPGPRHKTRVRDFHAEAAHP